MACNIEQLLSFLVIHHVLLESWWCEGCGELCRKDLSKFAFCCDRRHVIRDSRRRRKAWRCRYRRSMFTGTWFARSHLSVAKVCEFSCLWLNLPYPRQFLLKMEIGVSVHTVVNWSSYCREVCTFWLEKESVVLGGPDVVVEIYEAKLGKQRCNTGGWIGGQWFFGGFEPGSKNCFLVPVPSCGSDALLDIIKEWINPGTTVVSDCWKAYDCLSSEVFVHESVNHSINFIGPQSGAHTQNSRKTWREVLGGTPHFGRSKKLAVGYLAEFLFKRKYSHYPDRVHAFFTAVGQLYSPAPQQSN